MEYKGHSYEHLEQPSLSERKKESGSEYLQETGRNGNCDMDRSDLHLDEL